MQSKGLAEVASCGRMKTQLQNCLSRVDKLQRELDECSTSKNEFGDEQEETSGGLTEPLLLVGQQRVSTPQLDELESYRTLVERLQAELRWERAERETSDNNLASLRSSYQMLLQRVTPPQP